MPEIFAEELATYRRHLVGLIAHHRGRWVVIYGTELLGVYDTYCDALTEGYRQCGFIDVARGVKTFLVKRVEDEGVTRFFSRDIGGG